MASNPTVWHYTRADLTDDFMVVFEIGSSQSLTLFAPRRMGKSEFILHDLIPEAERQGYKTAYVDFWTHQEDPVRSLRSGLELALATTTLTEKLTSRRFRLKDVGFQAGIGLRGPNLGVTSRFEPSEIGEDQLADIETLLRDLMKGQGKVLLCLDEVQHLATDRRFEPVIYFLRSQIQRYLGRLNVVYTGSSRDGLTRLFRRRKAPLFQSTSQIDLPRLGAGFVRHIMQAFEATTGRTVSFPETLQAFKKLSYNPAEFRNVIHALVLDGGTDVLEITADYLASTDETDEYQDLWTAIAPIDQAVLSWIAHDGSGLYQKSARTFIADWIGMPADELTRATIQTAVRRLRGRVITSLEKGVWEIEDPRLKDWLTRTTPSIEDQSAQRSKR